MACSSAVAVDLSTRVYPSESELETSFLFGDIDSLSYSILKELFVYGIDSSQAHLWDQIPNLSHFPGDYQRSWGRLQPEQKAPFEAPNLTATRVTGYFSHRQERELEESGRSKYYSTMRARIDDRYELSLRIRKEYSGRERVIGRSISYRNPSTFIRELRVGTYTKRLGLGVAYGYRGKLLDFSDELDSESFLFPDYGGRNGIYGRIVTGKIETQILSSIVRDLNHSLGSLAVMFSRIGRGLTAAIIVGRNRLRNRSTDINRSHSNYGLFLSHRYSSGSINLEAINQDAEGSSQAVVVEGAHRADVADIKYSGWYYGRDYEDLSSGSKAVNLRRTRSYGEVEFEYSTKRSGQTGGMIRTAVPFIGRTELISSLLFGIRERDYSEVQILSAIEKELSGSWSIRADYWTSIRSNENSDGDRADRRQRMRIETRFTSGKISARNYIAYNTGRNSTDYLGMFCNLRYRSSTIGNWEMWVNLSRVDPNRVEIDNGYWYLRNWLTLAEGVEGALKLSQRLQRSEKIITATTVSFEVSAKL